MISWAQFARGRGTPAENYWYTLYTPSPIYLCHTITHTHTTHTQSHTHTHTHRTNKVYTVHSLDDVRDFTVVCDIHSTVHANRVCVCVCVCVCACVRARALPAHQSNKHSLDRRHGSAIGNTASCRVGSGFKSRPVRGLAAQIAPRSLPSADFTVHYSFNRRSPGRWQKHGLIKNICCG